MSVNDLATRPEQVDVIGLKGMLMIVIKYTRLTRGDCVPVYELYHTNEHLHVIFQSILCVLDLNMSFPGKESADQT